MDNEHFSYNTNTIRANPSLTTLRTQRFWSLFFVEITGQGLSVNYFGGHGKIKWDEARRFARYPTFGDRKSKRTITYELSSTTDIIRWTWIQRKSFLSSMEPAIPLAAYHQQMQALLSLIAAKTGLPLYDLRQNRSSKAVSHAHLW